MIQTPEVFQIFIEFVVLIIEIIVGIIVSGIIIITLASFFNSIILKLRNRQEKLKFRGIVIRMLRGLLLVADFLIAADLLQTILDPTLEESIILTMIVVLRILLSWSLSKEIEISRKSADNNK